MNSRRLMLSPAGQGQRIVQAHSGTLEEAARVRFGQKADIQEAGAIMTRQVVSEARESRCSYGPQASKACESMFKSFPNGSRT
jgi:hypothetical protein